LARRSFAVRPPSRGRFEGGVLPAGVGWVHIGPRGDDLVDAIEHGVVEAHVARAELRLELGRPSPARWFCGERRSVASYNRCRAGKWAGAGWESEAAVVLLEPSGQQNRR